MFSLSSYTSSCVYWGQSYLVTLVTSQNCTIKCLQILLLLYICIKPKERKQERKRNSNFCNKKQLYFFLNKVSATFSEIAGNLWEALNCTRAQFVPAILWFRHRIFSRLLVITRSRDYLTGLLPLWLARIITLFCLYVTQLKTAVHKLFWFTLVICIVWTSVNSLCRSSSSLKNETSRDIWKRFSHMNKMSL